MSSPANPGSLHHELGGWEFYLEADGSLQGWPLDINRQIGKDKIELQLPPADVWALALLFKMPGVRALLNRCELQRQHERHVKEEAEGE